MSPHRYACLIALLAFAVTLGWTDDVRADQRGVAEVPVQVGVGPAGHLFGGPTFDEVGWGGGLFDDQPIHTGFRLSITAVVTSELVEEHPRLVPGDYRGYVRRAGEVRVSPAVLSLIPSTVYLSPPIADASVWGATWSVIGAGLTLLNAPVRAAINGRVIATFMYIDSESVQAPYLFARPGVKLNFDVEIPISTGFLVSLGWSSKVHVPPQPLTEGIVSSGSYDEHSLWHIGQFYLQGHYRFPFRYNYAGR